MTNLILGDSHLILKTMADDSIDAVVTDPPYGLSFMNKHWDHDVPSVELWREVLRVLKPGGHVLSFGGTRTYHRMVVNIEDAGFEIRDCIAWLYGQGFPKSQNVVKMGQEKGLFCGCISQSESRVRPVSNTDLSSAVNASDKRREVLQPLVPEQSSQSAMLRTKSKKGATDGTKRSLEGRRDVQANEGELSRPKICSMPGSVSSNVQSGRICNGTPSCDGDSLGTNADTNGSRSSQRSQHAEQSDSESRTVREQSTSQACGSCGKTIFDPGLGTALKPALEPIVLARKPLIGTVAENVQTFGTGALNIDASRIATTDNLNGGTYSGDRRPSSRHSFGSRVGSGALKNGIGKEYTQPHGRWPANVLFDESAAEFLDASLAENGINLHAPGNKNKTRIRNGKNVKFNGAIENVDASRFQLGGDPTKASRFFYVAKASKRERGEGNVHPTVKPIKLMEYLVKLVTPPNGTVFDPFMGSGTTGIAAKSLGFGFVGIERSEEYFEIAKRRI